MISRFRLRFGRAPGMPPDWTDAPPVTVFVGPNNSGKSKILSELHQFCSTGNHAGGEVILGELEFVGFAPKEANELVEIIKVEPRPGEARPGLVILESRGRRSQQVALPNLLNSLQNPNASLGVFCSCFASFYTLLLDGRRRIDLVNQQSAGDLQGRPQSSFQVLFRDRAKRCEVRRIVADALGLYFVVDPTNLGQLRIRLSRRPPDNDLEECGIHEEAVKFQAAAPLIDSFSDGVKAFTGIVTELIAGDPRVMLIDEPEAFLHPSLAFKLGCALSRAALDSNKRVFASTHSPFFVRGCVQSGAPVNIVRLTYREETATARLLPSSELIKLMGNPLLRSTGVLSGLFYECVVVAESDADRAFYEEINERLLRFKPDWGIPNCLFINAQNKQTVQTIVGPLRNLGIPAAGVVDIDVLKDGGCVWTDLLDSAFVPSMSHQSLATLRAALKKAMEETGKNMKRDGGVSILSSTDQEAARNLLAQLAEYGIFVVAGGELESWLGHLGATGHGPPWLIDIFERMGEDAEAANFVRPPGDDVWEFLGKIKTWLVDPKRKGIPA